MHGEPKVYKLDPKAELDFRRKSGPLELVLVLKSDGGVDVYHTSQVQEIKQPRHDTKTLIHRGKDRDPETEADIEKRLKDKGLKGIDLSIEDFQDAGLTEIVREEEPSEAFPAYVSNATGHVTPLTYLLLNNSCYVSGGGWSFGC